MLRNPQIKRVFWSAGVLTLLVVAALVLLPMSREMKYIVSSVAAFAMLTIYPPTLSRSFKPKFVPVALYVDQSGMYADGAPLVLRGDIAQAYIKPAFEKRTYRPKSHNASLGYYSFNISTPPLPLTVELATRAGGFHSIDPGGQEAAANILTALGFPVTMGASQDELLSRPIKTSGRAWIKTVLVVVLFLAALFGGSFYMYYKVHQSTHRPHHAAVIEAPFSQVPRTPKATPDRSHPAHRALRRGLAQYQRTDHQPAHRRHHRRLLPRA